MHSSSHGPQSVPLSDTQYQRVPRVHVRYPSSLQEQHSASWVSMPDHAQPDLQSAQDHGFAEQDGVSISPQHRQPWDWSLTQAAGPSHRLLSTDALLHSQSDPGPSGHAPTSQPEEWEDQARQEVCCQQIILQQQQLMLLRHQAQERRRQQQQLQLQGSQQLQQPLLSSYQSSCNSSQDSSRQDWQADSPQLRRVMQGWKCDDGLSARLP